MRKIDFDVHNAEVKEVWDAYHQGKPIRTPMILGINPRFTMEIPEANPNSIDFEAYSTNPWVMLQRQLEHQYWVRHHIPQDTEMGLPKNGWTAYVDFQNSYEAAWFGCKVEFRGGQVPDTIPILKEEGQKRILFERGIPHPFSG